MSKGIIVLSFLLGLFGCVNPSATKNKVQVVESMATAIEKKYKKVSHLNTSTVRQLMSQQKTILVDVRDPKEYNVSTIKDAISVDEFKKNKEKYRDYHVIAYCTIGQRSTEYAEELIGEGFKASNLRGGILAWAHAGLEFSHQGKNTKKAHVYSEAWDFLPEGYESVSE